MSSGQYWHASINPWAGCTKVGPGCTHCFSAAMAHRFSSATGNYWHGVEWGKGKPRAPKFEKATEQLIKLRAVAECSNARPRSLTLNCDPFDTEVPQGPIENWIERWLNLVWSFPEIDFLLTTKRIKNAARFTMPPNVWLGVSVSNQEEADRDLPILLSIPATKRWISYEPALGPLMPINCSSNGLSWLVAGAETGSGARAASLDWFRAVRLTCRVAGIPFFLKQVDAKRNRLLDGREHNEVPV